MKTQASAEAMVRSKSFASLRHLPSQANVRSTTHRRGRTSKPLALSVRLTISSELSDLLQRAPQLRSGIAAIGEDMMQPWQRLRMVFRTAGAPSRS